MGNFRITSGKGFHLTFDNGYTISTQIGYGNYCENNHNFKVYEMLSGSGWGIDITSKNCEIAIWNKEGAWVTQEVLNVFDKELECSDSVLGYLDFNIWINLIDFIKDLK